MAPRKERVEWDDTIMRIGDRVLPTRERIMRLSLDDETGYRISDIIGTSVILLDEYDETFVSCHICDMTHNPDFPLAKWFLS